MRYFIYLLATFATLAFAKNELPENYVNANQSYQAGLYSDSIKFYKDFMLKCRKEKCDTNRRLFALDILGTIYIRHLHNPKELKSYLEKYKKGVKLNDAVDDEINNWIEAARDYLSVKNSANKVNDSNTLYSLGSKYFDRGQKMKKYPMDRKGNPYLSIASSYLLQYIYKFDAGKDIGDALYKMGIIRSTLWYEKNFWTQNHYFKETIRRFPGTDIAKKAYQSLEEELKASYTGSAGDFTPSSQLELLNYFKDIAYGKFKENKPAKVDPIN